MLVAAFKIEIGRKARLLGVRAAQHSLVGRAGVEPDIERVAVLLVNVGVVTEQLARIEGMPDLDAATLDTLGDLLEQLGGARMQRAGFAMDEKGHRHAPLPLTRQCPVGPVGDHRVQSGLTPMRIEVGGLDGSKRPRAQGLARGRLDIHAGEPLVGGPIDDRCLVPPAVHIAVDELFCANQRAGFAHGLDDQGVGVPDFQAGKIWQRCGIPAVTHHRIEDVVILHAIALAGQKVLDAIGG